MRPTADLPTTELTLDEQLAAANNALNAARAARVLADLSAHQAHLDAKKVNRDELSAAERRFDDEVRRIDKARKAEAAKAK